MVNHTKMLIYRELPGIIEWQLRVLTINDRVIDQGIYGSYISLILNGINRKLQVHPCPVCNSIFVVPMHLRQHVLHTHIQPYKCRECAATFSTFRDINSHFMELHRGQLLFQYPVLLFYHSLFFCFSLLFIAQLFRVHFVECRNPSCSSMSHQSEQTGLESL